MTEEQEEYCNKCDSFYAPWDNNCFCNKKPKDIDAAIKKIGKELKESNFMWGEKREHQRN